MRLGKNLPPTFDKPECKPHSIGKTVSWFYYKPQDHKKDDLGLREKNMPH